MTYLLKKKLTSLLLSSIIIPSHYELPKERSQGSPNLVYSSEPLKLRQHPGVGLAYLTHVNNGYFHQPGVASCFIDNIREIQEKVVARIFLCGAISMSVARNRRLS
jgi:hypothetical protein